MARRKFKPITIGDPFGRLTVLGEAEWYVSPKSGERRRQWHVRCECGTEKDIAASSLNRGLSSSCGCLHVERSIEASTTHGLSTAAEWESWSKSKQRCYNPNNEKYADYGGRGITVCERWRHDFSAFWEDMGPKTSPDHSIDRIDNDKGYWCGKAECSECGPLGREPNCKWATQKDQMRNTRSNVRITAFGKTMCLAAWAEETGIGPMTIKGRIRRGWSAEKAVSKSPKRPVT